MTTLSITGCGIHYNVKGRVVDATTGEPIEGASVAIRWTGTRISAYIAPYASGSYTIKRAKDVSDKDGYFTIPKYLHKSFYMGVYKQGYVCWDENHIFLQGAPKDEKDEYGVGIYNVKDKPVFHVKNGMIIELEPFTVTDMEIRARHASFVLSVSRNAGDLEGIEKEVQFYDNYYWKK